MTREKLFKGLEIYNRIENLEEQLNDLYDLPYEKGENK